MPTCSYPPPKRGFKMGGNVLRALFIKHRKQRPPKYPNPPPGPLGKTSSSGRKKKKKEQRGESKKVFSK